MILATINKIPGKEYEILGIVQGSIVHSKNIGRDIGASLKTLVGGEIKGYSQMLDEARDIAKKRMLEQAIALGADAIIGIEFSSSTVMAGAAEILAYGTAVKFI